MREVSTFKSLYTFCEGIIIGLRDITSQFFYTIQTPLADLLLDTPVFNILTPWAKVLLRTLLNNTPIGELSIITIMFSTGLITFIILAVIKYYT